MRRSLKLCTTTTTGGFTPGSKLRRLSFDKTENICSKKWVLDNYAQVFFEQPDKWFELEQMIYDSFNAERQKKSSKHAIEEVNIDDIPDDLGQ